LATSAFLHFTRSIQRVDKKLYDIQHSDIIVGAELSTCRGNLWTVFC